MKAERGVRTEELKGKGNEDKVSGKQLPKATNS